MKPQNEEESDNSDLGLCRNSFKQKQNRTKLEVKDIDDEDSGEIQKQFPIKNTYNFRKQKEAPSKILMEEEQMYQEQPPKKKSLVPSINISDDESQLDKTVENSRQNILCSENSLLSENSRLKQKAIIHPKGTLSFIILRNQEGLNKINPIFRLNFLRTNEFIVCAKMVKNNTFILSKSEKNFTQNGGDFYVGKVKANVFGNEIYIFGPGYNPKDAYHKKMPKRQMLATVQFKTGFFQGNRPREFDVFVLKKGVKYDDLFGKQSHKEEPLSSLYSNEFNKENIMHFKNKMPVYNEQQKIYKLDFHGKIKQPSLKNFILKDAELNYHENKEQIMRMLFGKVSADKFLMEVTDSISPLVGFGIALGSFGLKFGVS